MLFENCTSKHYCFFHIPVRCLKKKFKVKFTTALNNFQFFWVLSEVKIVVKLKSAELLWKKNILMKLYVCKSKHFQRIMSTKKGAPLFQQMSKNTSNMKFLILEMSVFAVLDKLFQVSNTIWYIVSIQLNTIHNHVNLLIVF